MTSKLLTTALAEWHRKAGAKMVPFAGWEMPVQYSGILDEHRHTREQAGIFDISHMGEFLISGSKALDDLSAIVTQDLKTLAPGKCRYGFMLNEKAGVLDDLIVYRLAEDKFMAVVNGACMESDFEWIKNHLSSQTVIENHSLKIAKIDLQGPLSFEVLQNVLPGHDWMEMKYFNFKEIDFLSQPMLVSRTGYTGELGCEFYLPWENAAALWELLLTDSRVKPIGLGARDTLRLEIGLPLYGQDLDIEHSPVEAGYGFMLKSEADFTGKEQLETVREKLIPLSIEGRRSARHNDLIQNSSGETIGTVTSGSFAPSLGHSIALAYVRADSADLETFTVKSKRYSLKAQKSALPFYSKGTARIKLKS